MPADTAYQNFLQLYLGHTLPICNNGVDTLRYHAAWGGLSYFDTVARRCCPESTASHCNTCCLL